jgi:hypothetical protein
MLKYIDSVQYLLFNAFMTTHKRSDRQTAISVSIPKELLDLVDARAQAIGLNRSAYIGLLLRQDLATKDNLTVHETPSPSKPESPDAPNAAGSREISKYPPLPRESRRGKHLEQG